MTLEERIRDLRKALAAARKATKSGSEQDRAAAQHAVTSIKRDLDELLPQMKR